MQKPITFQFIKDAKALDASWVSVRLAPGKESVLVRNNTHERILEVGLGCAKDELTRRTFILAVRKIVFVARQYRISKLSLPFSELVFRKLRMAEAEIARLTAENFELANFEFISYKTPPEEGWCFVEEVMFTGPVSRAVKTHVARGQMVGAEVNACRMLANTPGGEMTPRLLAEAARTAVKDLPVEVTVLGKHAMEQICMGGVLGVARGSAEEPQFIIMRYDGGREKEKPVVLVGKGVTFDSGGLNLKPSDDIYAMHMDMSGGAAVVHTVALASRLRLPCTIIGLIPAVENMPSGSSYHPGDVLRSLSGKTIEVLNTDAEGRIILADGITYAKRYNPRLVIDVATLTGAAIVALGQRCSAIFTTDESLEKRFRKLGEDSGEYVWPLPLWAEYEEDIKGTFGDIANIGKSRSGGAITAAKFLHAFAKELNCPWAHIDIAPRMTSIEGEYLAKGAVGAPIRLLIKVLETI
jgi:leucyl aminopeptidase